MTVLDRLNKNYIYCECLWFHRKVRSEIMLLDSLLGTQLPILAEVAVLGAVGYILSAVITFIYFARLHKFSVPGPRFVQPFVGGLIQMIRDPYEFWNIQRDYSPNGYSWQGLMNQFVVFATKADLCHKIFTANSADTLTLVLHPNGVRILGEGNIAFQHGAPHKALRASFMNLFTQKALSLYLPIQERLCRKHLANWIKDYPHGSTPQEMRDLIRNFNCETSQTVFLGPHLADPVKFTNDYNNMTKGFLSPPIYFPGTTLYKAVGARKKVVHQLEETVRKSKAAMSIPGAESTCLLDFWSAFVLDEIKHAQENGTPLPHYAPDDVMAEVMMDFLFASQDASTASLVYLTATMCDHPDILQRVVEEQRKLRPNNEPLTYDLMQEMNFTRCCVLEQLRQHPPAPMVPMVAHNDFQLDENYTVPKGSYIIPSLVASCREGFPDPEKFDPDRMGPERQEDRKFSKQYIPFGVGPHRCVGYNYAIIHLTVYLALIASLSEWKRSYTPNSHKTMYLPTLYPWDCLCTWAAKQGVTVY